MKISNHLFTEQKKPKKKISKTQRLSRSKFILAQTTDSSLFLQTHRSALRCNKNPKNISRLSTDQKEKKKNKNPKTQTVFPDQNSDSLRLAILLCNS